MQRACSRCGTTAEVTDEDEVPLGWALSVEAKRVTVQCPDCSRANVRAIEGKLPEEWWEI